MWIRRGIGRDKSIAVPMHAQLSNQNVVARGGLRNRVAVGIYLNQLAAAHQPLQAFGELVPCRAVESQFPHQLLEAGGALGLAFDLLQDGGIGESIQARGLRATQIIIRRQPGTDAELVLPGIARLRGPVV